MNKNKTVTPGYATSVNLSKARSGHSPLLQSLRSIMLRSCVLFPLLVLPLDVNAVAVTPLTQIGDTVTNPVTNVDVTVLERILDPNDATGLQAAYVITSDGKTLLAKTQVGDTLGVDNGTSIDVYDILAVNVNATSGFVESVDMRLNTLPVTDPVVTQTVVSTTTASFGVPTGSQGAAGAGEVIPPTTTSGVIDERYKGANGSDGNDGYGVEVCDPVFNLGCVIVGYGGSGGGDGATGPPVGRNINSGHGLITSTASNVPGIRIGSTGGDGGQGGDAYGNFAAMPGGDGGAGGNVYVVNHTNVNVGGTNSYGMYIFSRSGDAGDGGTGYLFGSGGNGGAARDGGTVNVSNDGTITTSGQGAHGIYGLSVGGSAGNGGGSWGVVGSGGNGAIGGNGGAVNISNNGIIHTTGKSAHGILAQSIGGTGGNGGSAGGIVAFGGDASQGGVGRNVTVTNQASADITTEGNYAVGVMGQSIGGSGGDSGAAGGIVALGARAGYGSGAGTVTINNAAGSQITTLGKGAYGVLAQSIGGGGGNSLATGGVVSVGGNGSGGGNGNAVTINSAADIDTAGAYAHGLFGQSIGGGGGSAGGGGGLVALGGKGGAAGWGSTVQITNSGTIYTAGIDARGIFGQSIGGGGGAGGATGGLVALGGAGSGGGGGGSVYATNAVGARIDTVAKGADAMFLQSIGGGGGSGASSGGLVALGGAASGAGNGGFVRATNNGVLTTKGDLARGIFVQSIGGGGGSGGVGGGLVAIAGSGGAASTGGNVEVNTGDASNITTTGQYSIGIFAQSIGGGGGIGGSSGGLIAIGGKAGGGGNAGAVSLNTGGNVTTIGNDSTAIFAQSIGGGGGNSLASGGLVSIGGSGNSGGGHGQVVNVISSSILNTVGNNSHGIQAQSVGGGGGNAGPTGGLVSIGGTGGNGGWGRAVNVINSGAIHTQGLDSRGIFAQSIGGGGGSGGVSGGLVSLGGGGSGAGNAGNVTITNAVGADIWTEGEGSDAIFGQSIGGGGGSGAASGGLVSLGGKGNSGGQGGVVSISNEAILWTDGDWARGIFGQSIGGGGGSGGDTGGLVSIGGSSGTGSNANNVIISSNGDIRTLGDNATAVYAQSVGGGGGNGGSSGGAISIGGAGVGGGNGGNVNVATTGVIDTTGNNSSGIFTQSVGGGGGDGATSGGIVTIGGSAGPGSSGGIVSASHGGVIHTRGEDAVGIFAQSVGGGGGNGGGSYSGGLFAGFSLGGNGNSGGFGGTVNVDLNTFLQGGNQIASLIQTENDRSTGILAQSVGGGGGNGGNAVQATVGTGVSLSVAIGGNAGAGGEGGVVGLTGIGDVKTFGNNAGGVVLQSVGGGGGNGGMSVSASAQIGDGVAIGVAIGGEGGSGGKGGVVTADVESNIETQGEFSTGFLAQSVGGGGGNGGTTIAATAAVGLVGAAAISVGVGGNGGSGGIGDHVDVTLSGSVLTFGDQSDGVVIQSVGGGGGNAGLTVAAGAAGAGEGAANITASVGGSGGDGGLAGRVDANIVSNVETQGDGSDGVIIQSIGGGGGNSGLTISAGLSGGGVGAGGINVGVGGSGGGGGNGDIVVADYDGTLLTFGNNSTGLLAQSVGGGGGNSGGAIAASLNGGGEGAGSISVGIGGSGGIAGDGGKAGITTAVTLNATGIVTTNGDNSSAIVAQSIGGGGGNGGYSVTAGISAGGIGSGAIGVGLGGSGSGGGLGKGVDSNVSSNIWTYGDNSVGMLSQSIGGGGGNGGFNVSALASGAGVGSAGVSVGLGGSGAAGGQSGLVNAISSGSIYTEGDNSAAFIAQSIGGGGGNGGFNVSFAAATGETGSGVIGVGLGGSGDVGGNGGAVIASTSGQINTLGDSSTGILAQSVGGGGGNGGFNVSVTGAGAVTGSAAVGVGLGGSGAGGGDAAIVDLTVANNVSTEGNDSAAIIAQSVGGGGGNGGFNVTAAGAGAVTGSGAVSVGLGGSAGLGGNAGDAISSVIGDILTGGENSTGLLVQSVGGGGGNGGFNVSAAITGGGMGAVNAAVGIGGSGGGGGISGVVTSVYSGNLSTTGKNATGVIAQSVAGGGGNGGLNISGSISAAKAGSFGAAVGIGGSGGSGGNANLVDNTVNGEIVTTSESGSGGVLAQSVGGGGGNGGINVSGTIALSGEGAGAVSVGLGGSGGSGGDAGIVMNTVNGNVYTDSKDGFGVVAQSVGGGGGNGGINVSGTIAIAKTGAGAVGVGLGGSGGGGGDAAQVNNAVTGYVQTLKDNSIGILAQSVGGGGGNGGLNVTGNITGAKTGSGGIAVGIGGFGGTGGNGADVINNVIGGTVTTGDNSEGIVAQSLGGGGGNGAINVTASINLTKENGGVLGIGLGGFGGDGGNAANVTSTIVTTPEFNQIGTTGDNSSAVVAQSIGGSGGNGALNVTGSVNLTGANGAAVGVGVGGFGGGAGNAGGVTLDVTGLVVTEGNNSHGLLAQSIGGGGGNGGTNISGSLAVSSASQGSGVAVAASIGIGGFGGLGGTAGDVDVSYAGTIMAQPRVFIPEVTLPIIGTIPAHYAFKDGTGSHGIAAQSIGGGGGNGAINVSGGISYGAGDGSGYGLVVGFGGFGGAGGDAGIANVNVTGGESISAYGAGHSAILAQSLGGGGGNGALNVSGGIVSDSSLVFGLGGFGGDAGVGKNVTVNATADVFASAADSGDSSSAGILAQSIGGGGGNGGMNVSGGIAISKPAAVPSITVGVGGFGGAGSVSGDVNVVHDGNAITSGDWIHGIMAQSIAGGGGNGGMNISGQFNWAESANSGGLTDLSIVAGVGGNAGAGADAGNVSVNSSGIVTTQGDNARGIAAQSIGGGGGTGGMNVTGVFAKNSSPISVGVGGSGSGGGHAGSVVIDRGDATVAAGKVTTDGDGAYAIEASSIGGGGGDAGMNFIVGVSLAGADNTDAGFAAQFAIGGAGGVAADGNTATVNNYSDIETKQNNSHGIIAQSIGGGGGNANFNLAATYAGSNKKNMGFDLAIGGATGDGGDGARVDVVHQGNIETFGSNSFGILSQSIGGGGGNAGMDMVVSKAEGGKVGITIGRAGGTGGVGADVTLSSNGVVQTHGYNSFGMLAQSIGNGGGNSSSTKVSLGLPKKGDASSQSASVAVGLEGGIGGRAGNVLLNASGWVSTFGENAHAIFAQSVGGGGGNGGAASTKGLWVASASLALGGTGGEGGVGGDVDVASSAEVRTNNINAVGILAQSIGGGGGTGGKTTAGGIQSNVAGVNVAVGGGGGVGMSSGLVSVDNSGVIITDGKGSHGVLAQSLGGGGGNAGMTINAIAATSSEALTRVAVSVGGSGGEGAISNNVTVMNTGGIGTNQERSVGIFAQSIGGGGGNADNVITSSVTGAGGGNNFSVGIGGVGGVGGAAGDILVSNLDDSTANSGQIITLGNYSHGIMAMSIGGGGGTGSNTITSNKGFASPSVTTNTANFSLGGEGGQGGTGGIVDVLNDGEITTYGYGAHGILAQSVGGGGGNGGLSIAGDFALGAPASGASSSKVATLAIGGFGGSGNVSGDVTVTNSGSIEIFGDKAYGIYAQSVGGGGGDAGLAIALSRNILSNPTTNLAASLMNIAVGGNAGDGADSGDVLVEHTGSITVHGDNSYGIYAQSVGGGGGNVSASISNPVWMATDFAVSSLIGGRDGSKGQAGTVTINTEGDILMLGANSQAQFAQSVNGGGGNVDLFLDFSQQAVEIGDDGFELPADTGDVAFVNSLIEMGTSFVQDAAGSAIDSIHKGAMNTLGDGSFASFLQSIGGGGGNSTTSVMVASDANVDLVLALGGAESSNSGGGDINQTRDGNVGTEGDQSQGVGVQSIGGGGGNLSVNVRTVPAPAPAPVVVAKQLLALALPAKTATLQLGSDMSVDNNGGDINLAYTGDVSTLGDRSAGLNIQSIGGGGGQVSMLGLDVFNVSVGASGNSSGNGGNINVSNTGLIFTEGVLSHGVMLQSIGGGGGSAFTDMDASAITLSLNADNMGNGGIINFDQTGDVIARGDRAIGIFAQSLGGGGGVVDRLFADSAGGAGIAGAINLSLNDNVAGLGQNGVGVFAQSRGADGQGDITITLAENMLIAGGENGVGVWLSGGGNNSFVNRGSVSTLDEIEGWAVIAEEGNDVIDNYGTLHGQLDLGAGINRVNNYSSNFFVPGAEILLGDVASQLFNDGLMIPGDTGLAQSINMTGSFVQSATGLTFSELDFATDAIDQISMTGTADLNGELVVSLLTPELVPIGHFQKDLFAADLGVTDNGLFMTTAPSVVITYDLIYPTANAAVLDYNVDFAPDALSGDLQGVGEYVNRIQIAGSSPELANTITALLYVPTIEGYSDSLSQLTPDFYAEHQAEAIRGSQQFGQIMADQGEGRFGQNPASGSEYRFVENDKVLWFQAENNTNTHKAYGDYRQVNHATERFGMGMHQDLDDTWSYGLGVAYESNQSDGYDGRWVSSGNTQHLGFELKRQSGSSQIALLQTYSWTQADTLRAGNLTESFQTNVNRELETYGGILRFSDMTDEGSMYVRSALDLGVTRLMAEAASESGAGPTSLDLKSYSETHTWIKPAIRFGYKHTLQSRAKMNLFAGLGIHHYFNGGKTEVLAGFAGAPQGVGAMQVPVDLNETYLEGVVGIDLLNVEKATLGLQYNTIFDKHTDFNHFSINLNVPF